MNPMIPNEILTLTASATLTGTRTNIEGDATAGLVVATLPLAKLVRGIIFQLAKIDPVANVFRVAAQPGETINGDPTCDLFVQYDNVTLRSNGTEFVIL